MAEREGSGRPPLSNNEAGPHPAGGSDTASECEVAGLNETRQARQGLAAPTKEVAKMKAAHSAEIAGHSCIPVCFRSCPFRFVDAVLPLVDVGRKMCESRIQAVW